MNSIDHGGSGTYDDSTYPDTEAIHYSLYRDAVGGAWMLSHYAEVSGIEEHYAFTSETRAKRYARDEWNVRRWMRSAPGSSYQTAEGTG